VENGTTEIRNDILAVIYLIDSKRTGKGGIIPQNHLRHGVIEPPLGYGAVRYIGPHTPVHFNRFHSVFWFSLICGKLLY